MEWYSNYVSVISILFLLTFVILFYSLIQYQINKDQFKDAIIRDAPHEQILQDLDVIYLYKDSCPYCTKMNKILHKEKIYNFITYVNALSVDGNRLMNVYNINSVPAFISKTTNKISIGYIENIKCLLNKLKR
jgi:glutaredoxin